MLSHGISWLKLKLTQYLLSKSHTIVRDWMISTFWPVINDMQNDNNDDNDDDDEHEEGTLPQ